MELERKQRQGMKMFNHPREYCAMCDLHFFGHLISHRKNVRHQVSWLQTVRVLEQHVSYINGNTNMIEICWLDFYVFLYQFIKNLLSLTFPLNVLLMARYFI